MVAPSVVVPGQRLTSTTECKPGEGTYERDGYIFASVVGILSQTSDTVDVCISSRS